MAETSPSECRFAVNLRRPGSVGEHNAEIVQGGLGLIAAVLATLTRDGVV